MSDLPFKLPVRLYQESDGEIINGDGDYCNIIDIEDALNLIPLLLSIAEAAEKVRSDGHSSKWSALDTALSAWREGKGNNDGH